jgi:DNA repair exonuclease SbcCD ATPase subunit
MIKLRSIELESFRSFKDKTLIRFKEENGIILLSGISGSGKTSIILGVAYALGFCKIPATSLAEWSTGQKPCVTLTLSDGPNVYVISRSPKLSLTINGVEIEGKSTALESKIAEILKAEPDLVEALTYRPQRKFGRFLNQTDKENKEFLSLVLGLNKFEEASEAIDKKRHLIDGQLQTVKEQAEFYRRVISSTVVTPNELENAVKSLEAAKKDAQDAQMSGLPPDLKTAYEAASTQFNNIRNLIAVIPSKNAEIANIDNRLRSIATEIAHMQKNTCYTCSQPWMQAQEAMQVKKNEGKELLIKKKTLSEEVSALPELKSREAELSGTVQNLYDQVSAFQLKKNQAASQLQLAESLHRTVTEKYRNLDQTSAKLSSVLDQIAALEFDKIQHEHMAAILGRSGFLGTIFDEVLAEIELYANSLIENFDNINRFYLKIDSNAVTKEGVTKKSINFKVYYNGEPVSSTDLLSGGQQAALELCTDLAVSAIIKQRTGSKLGWIILDEAIEGLDIEIKQKAIEIIKQKVNGVVIIIDHATEIKQCYDQIIEVSHNGQKSIISQ